METTSTQIDEASHIGRGIEFPLEAVQRASTALDSGPAGIERSMKTILATAPGERVMRPDFGCAIWDLLFEPVDDRTIGRMIEAVREALSRWEPRVEVEGVDVVPDDELPGAVRIDIAYTLRATNDRRHLVFPFCVIPGGEDDDDAGDGEPSVDLRST